MTIYKHLIALILLIFYSYATEAKTLHWPDLCSEGQLTVTNKTATTTTFWLQTFAPVLSSEAEYQVESGHQVTISLSGLKPSSRQALLYFTESNSQKLTAELKCSDYTAPATENEGGEQIFKKPLTSDFSFYLKNLTNLKNVITIEYLDAYFKTLHKESVSMENQEQGSFSFQFNENYKYIKITGELKFTSFIIFNKKSQLPFMINPEQVPKVDGIYFVVSPRSNQGDSFVVNIKDPQLVSKAREQIKNPTLEKILFGKIQIGSNHFNRNWNSLSKSFWSWSVSEVTNISDLASTSCNGFPQAVEDRLDSWVNDPGRICFWTYRIKQELSPEEVATGQLKGSP